jgi:diacylglycerol kinase family enzyme/membrane-associated phospholipid phosphatase
VDRLVIAGMAAAGILFAALLVGIGTGWSWVTDIDQAVADWFHQLLQAAPLVVGVLEVLDVALDPWVWRGLTVVVAVALYRRGERRVAAWLVSLVIVNLLVEILVKAAVERPRPELPEPFLERAGSGFPSGHAFASALFIGAFLVLVQRDWGVRKRRAAAWICGLFLAALVGLDRVALGLHFMSDVVAGWLFALAVLAGMGLAFGLTPGAIRRRAMARGYGRRRVAVVINPSKLEDPVGFRQQLNRLADERGWRKPLWFETTVDDAGHAMAKQALEAKADLVIAAGGDGTVRVVCGELAGTGVPVGVVPVGTGNLLARNLGLPLDPATAIRVALGGRDRRIDLVRVRGDRLPTDRFAVMAGLGLDAAIISDAPPHLKRQIGWTAYLVSAAKNINHPSVRVRITLDEELVMERRVRTVVVGNVGMLQANIPLLPDARPDDGLLDVVVIAPRRVTQWPIVVWRLMTRTNRADMYLERFTGRKVEITAAVDVQRQLDGDPIGPGRSLTAEIEAGALVARVPKRR